MLFPNKKRALCVSVGSMNAKVTMYVGYYFMQRILHESLWSYYNGILSFVTYSGVKVTFSSSSISSFNHR